jgi:hypothetical protein
MVRWIYNTEKYSKVAEQFLVYMEKKHLLTASVSYHDHTSFLNSQLLQHVIKQNEMQNVEYM